MTITGRKVRVLVVEDSKIAAMLLEHVIREDGRFDFLGIASSGEEALGMIPRLSPDVVLMDVHLPGIDGVETTRRIMRIKPTPIVVTSASLNGSSVNATMDALQAGALSVIDKPLTTRREEFPRLSKRLCNQLMIMSQVKVVLQRQRPATDRTPAPVPSSGSARPLSETVPGQTRPAGVHAARHHFRMLGLVASTGGPQALAKVLGALPKEYPLPVVVVQHIGAEFTEGFAAWLDSQVPMPVRLARNGETPAPGQVYVAPGGAHLVIAGGMLMLDRAPPLGGQRPSGTILFQSMANAYADRAIGVLLTGMGDDGAAGLLEIHRVGGHTIAEDECTAVVYGMPAVAVRLGAARLQLPLDAIGLHILQTTKNSRPS
ncbi:chemotaxis-specific protein-glutamate methyltransferase CheB [Geminicoccus roseus]|uniref:chemotaxis-specific protein-glutamate methyltransferase CheB n=1 Tax=Geminicoccus roseus TaxID=404900 RepID=UPI000554F09D|nr:chemotaxis-specific protein-glutamate methyltransferase CheB [Geminicoccus roseus]